MVDSESRLRSVIPPSPGQGPAHGQSIPAKSSALPSVAVGGAKVKDAACGTMIDPAKAVAEGNTLTRDGVTYYFCSDRCKKKFDAQPEHYSAMNASGQRP